MGNGEWGMGRSTFAHQCPCGGVEINARPLRNGRDQTEALQLLGRASHSIQKSEAMIDQMMNQGRGKHGVAVPDATTSGL
jgi:hypothetical protein